MRADVATSYVRDLLERFTGVRPDPDQDGDLPIEYNGSPFYVRIVGSDAIVQVFAVAVGEVEASPGLHELINGINADARFARVFQVADQVLVEHDIWADDVNMSNLNYACRTVAEASDHFSHQIIERFGGKRPTSSAPEPATPDGDDGHIGIYL